MGKKWKAKKQPVKKSWLSKGDYAVVRAFHDVGLFGLKEKNEWLIWDKKTGVLLGRYDVTRSTLFIYKHDPVKCEPTDMPGVARKLLSLPVHQTDHRFGS